MKDEYTGKIGDLKGQYRELQNSKTKIKNLTESGNENENKMKTTHVEYDREKDGETGELQQQKCGKSMPVTSSSPSLLSLSLFLPLLLLVLVLLLQHIESLVSVFGMDFPHFCCCSSPVSPSSSPLCSSLVFIIAFSFSSPGYITFSIFLVYSISSIFISIF